MKRLWNDKIFFKKIFIGENTWKKSRFQVKYREFFLKTYVKFLKMSGNN